MALRKFTFNEGTTDNPVVLSQRQIDGLIAVINDDTVEKNISGVVFKSTMYNNEKHVLESAGFTVMTDNTLEDSFVIEPELPIINEGQSTKINAIGIKSETLVFEIDDINDVYNPEGMTKAEIKNKFRFTKNVLSVNPATKNDSWTVEVTVKAYPSINPSNYRTCVVTVNAVAISSVSITGPQTIKEGETATYNAAVFPTNHTKVHTSIAYNSLYGSFESNVYTAPEGFGSDVVSASIAAYNKSYSGSLTLLVGTVVLNNTDKQPLVFNAIKAGLKSSGWTQLNNTPIDSATEINTLDLYNITNANFMNILPNLKNINEPYSFDIGQYMLNVTEIKTTNANQSFGTKLTSVKLPNLNLYQMNYNGSLDLFYNCLLEEVELPSLNNVTTDRGSGGRYIQRALFDSCPNLTIIKLPKLTSMGNDNESCSCIANNCNSLIEVQAPLLATVYSGWIDNIQGLISNCKNLTKVNLNSLVSSSKVSSIIYNCGIETLSLPSFTNLNKTTNSINNWQTYIASDCNNLRSVYIPKLNVINAAGLFRNCAVLKQFIGISEIDESWDGEEGVLDWSNTTLTSINSDKGLFPNTPNIYKWKLPRTFTAFEPSSNYQYNSSNVCIVDIRKCSTFNNLGSLFYDSRDTSENISKLKFVRINCNIPPSFYEIGKECPIFVPTNRFPNYCNDTSYNKYFFENNTSHNVVNLYSNMEFPYSLTFNVSDKDVKIGSKIVLRTRFTGTNQHANFFESPNWGSLYRVGSNGSKLLAYNFTGATINTNISIVDKVLEFTLEFTMTNTKLSVKDIETNNIIFETTDTGNPMFGKYNIKTNQGTINFSSSELWQDGILIHRIVPALDEYNVGCVVDTVNNIKHYKTNTTTQAVQVYGSKIGSYNLGLEYEGTYDVIRVAYEQYLIDGTTKCPWVRGVSVNRLFPAEMMDWMCESIFGFPKTWSGELEDVPVNLLK